MPGFHFIRILIAASLLMLCAGCVGPRFNFCARPTENPECGAYSRQVMTAKFGAESAEDIAERGEHARRIFVKNAFHTGVIGVTFVRRPDGGSEVQVDLPKPREAWRAQPAAIRAPASVELWRRAVAATSDLSPVPMMTREPLEPGDILVCADGWLHIVEIVEGRDGPIRRAIRSSCEEERVGQVRDELAALARSAFPSCALLEHEVPVFALQDCGALGGERTAAAQALNRFNDLHGVSYRSWSSDEIAPYLRGDASLEWNGVRSKGAAAFARTWAAIPEPGRFSWLTVDSAVAESAERASISGFAYN
jgi:hypothetical protein